MRSLKLLLDYKHNKKWTHVNKAFSTSFSKRILDLFPDPFYSLNSSGKRDGSNEYRSFITSSHEGYQLFEVWNTNYAKQKLSDISGVDCTRGKLRIELCQDAPGFWLEKHIDIPEKLITLQIYLGRGKQEWGTTIYDHKDTITVPFIHNSGWMTYADSKCIHGVEPGAVDGVRRSIIINYVVGDWRDTDQLY